MNEFSFYLNVQDFQDYKDCYTASMKFEELTHKIIGCVMTVHHELGTGYPERIYQRALALEFESRGIQFLQEHSMDISYKGTRIGQRRVDFLVEDTIMLELKAVDQLNDTCLV